jgi:hypothetical protein
MPAPAPALIPASIPSALVRAVLGGSGEVGLPGDSFIRQQRLQLYHQHTCTLCDHHSREVAVGHQCSDSEAQQDQRQRLENGFRSGGATASSSVPKSGIRPWTARGDSLDEI